MATGRSLMNLDVDNLVLIIEQIINDKENFFHFSKTNSIFLNLCLEVLNKLPIYYAIPDCREKYLLIQRGNDYIQPDNLKLNQAITNDSFKSTQFTLYPNGSSNILELQRKSEKTEEQFFGCGGVAMLYKIRYQPTLFKIRSSCQTTNTTGNNLYFESASHTISDNIHEYSISNALNRKSPKL